MSRCYRLNIRFDLDDEKERDLAEKVKGIDKAQYGSVNKFILGLIDSHFNGSDEHTDLGFTLEDIKNAVKEAIESSGGIIKPKESDCSVNFELDKSEEEENGAAVLDALKMFM